jgi:hypothetical protein
MNFNFYDQYRVYSNVELLRIISRADEYQPEAVEAASLVLKDRNVTEEERAEVEQFFADKKAKAEKIEAYKDKAKDFFQPIIQPKADIKPGKWLNILLLLVVLDYLWILYDTIRDVVLYLRCAYCEFDLSFFLFSLLGIVYVPFIFYLLLKRKRWGWILLFADSGITALSRLNQMLLLFKYQGVPVGSTTTFIVAILIKVGFLIFLWRKEISDYFNVSIKAKQYTLIFLIFVTVLAFSGLFLSLLYA